MMLASVRLGDVVIVFLPAAVLIAILSARTRGRAREDAARGIPNPPHNRSKRPVAAVCVVVSACVLVADLLLEAWLFALVAFVGLCLSAHAVWTIRSGRRPWWLTAPFDKSVG
jgi:hypothetical protein